MVLAFFPSGLIHRRRKSEWILGFGGRAADVDAALAHVTSGKRRPPVKYSAGTEKHGTERVVIN